MTDTRIEDLRAVADGFVGPIVSDDLDAGEIRQAVEAAEALHRLADYMEQRADADRTSAALTEAEARIEDLQARIIRARALVEPLADAVVAGISVAIVVRLLVVTLDGTGEG